MRLNKALKMVHTQIQSNKQSEPIKPLTAIAIALFIIFITAFSLGDLAEIIPAFSSIRGTTLFELFHETHDLIAVILVLFVAYKYDLREGVAAISAYLLAHLPYFFYPFEAHTEHTIETIRIIFSSFIGFFSIWLISLLKTRQQKLKESEEKLKIQYSLLKSTFEAIPYPFYVIDANDYSVKMANSAARFGDLSKGPPCYALTHGKDKPCDSEPDPCPLAQMKKTRKPVTCEHVHYDESGKARTYDIFAYPVFNTEGDIVQMIEFCQDNTERKRMQEQLIAQDRLVSIGQLVSGVAHELNNPLTSVLGFSDILLQKELPNDIRSDLEIVNSEAKRTALIVKNLLTFARQQPQQKTLLDVNEPLQTVLQLRGHSQRANNITTETHLAKRLPPVLANISQIEQVFLNIIVNAEQAMIEAHNKGTLKIYSEHRGDFVRVTVTDDGPGISRENMSRLFTPFFTTKEIGKGTGLGLSISQGIILEHGGRIWAESEPGKGTTFFVELPIFNGFSKDQPK
ncbi:MAG: ATP-binding protein [Dehalococcoidales bacterium]|nr:ATP-binding protein [Dehalococcoidales bacterium]